MIFFRRSWRLSVLVKGLLRMSPVWMHMLLILLASPRLLVLLLVRERLWTVLKVAGVLREEGGNLVAAPETSQQTEIVEQRLVLGGSMHQDVAPSNVILSPRASSGVSLSIEVRVQCTPADLDGLGQKLRQVLKDFNHPGEPPAQHSQRRMTPIPRARRPRNPRRPRNAARFSNHCGAGHGCD